MLNLSLSHAELKNIYFQQSFGGLANFTLQNCYEMSLFMCCKERRISAADALLHPYLEDGRLRYHSCMCRCCYRVAGGRTVFADDPEPCHSQPFEAHFEQELTSVSRIRGMYCGDASRSFDFNLYSL